MHPAPQQRDGKTGESFSTLNTANLRPALLAPLAVLLLALTLGHAGLPLHDALGALVPSPALPAAVLTVDAPAEAASAAHAALRAGARAVWTADPALAGDGATTRLDPGLLLAGADERVREATREGRTVALPLPEALQGLLRLDARQLGDDAPATLLRDRDVVLISPATPIQQVEPVGGQRALVNRGELLAVALGVLASPEAGLGRLPSGLALALSALVALGWGLGLSRMPLHRGLLATGGLLVALALLALILRRMGVDLPIGGLICALTLPAADRYRRVCDAALGTVSAIRLALPPATLQEGPPRQPPTALGALLRDFSERRDGAPDATSTLERRLPAADPELGQIGLTEAAALHELRDADQTWTLLEQADAPVACFRADGQLIAAGRRLRERLGAAEDLDGSGAGLAWSEALRSELQQLLETTRAGAEVATVATPDGDALRVVPVRAGGRIQGFLVEAQDASAARSVRETLTGTQLALSGAVRDAMTAVQGLSERMATENRRFERGVLLQKLEAVQRELVRILEMVEGAVTGSGRPGPVAVGDHLRRTLALLPDEVRGRVSLERLPPCRPVLARSDHLSRAVGLLLVEAAGYGEQVHVTMSPGPDHVAVRIRDAGGGLPELALQRLAGPDGPSSLELVAGLLTSFGGQLEVDEEPGADRVLTVRLPYA